MKLKVKEFNIYVDETIIIIGILAIIFRGIREYFENYFICYLFITFHELSHMFVASIFGVKTTSLNIRISGLNVCLNKINKGGLKWLAIYLAGPFANIVLACMFKNVPMVYTINLALALINLIPIYPLDGYNIFKIILNILKLKQNNTLMIQKTTEIMVIIFFLIVGAYQFVFLKNLSIILMTFYIIIQASSLRTNWNLGMYQKYYKNITKF